MNIPFQNITNQYNIKKFTEKDIPDIYKLCKGNTTYYEYMKMEPTFENLKEVLTALPPQKSLDDKYFIGFYKEEQLVALLDLCLGFPEKETAYIGWFMVKKELHNTGIGKKIINDLRIFLKQEKFLYVELGCIKDNKEAQYFWKKNGFSVTGSESDTGEYIVLGMKLNLV